jgi:hypothetical protein
MRENGGGGVRGKKINGKLSTTNQMKEVKKAETKAFPNKKFYKTYFIKKAVRPMLS